MTAFKPFGDDKTVLTLGDDVTVENQTDRLTFTGAPVITRDKRGLALATSLKAVLDAVVQELQSQADLPDAVAVAPARRVRNPFA